MEIQNFDSNIWQREKGKEGLKFQEEQKIERDRRSMAAAHEWLDLDGVTERERRLNSVKREIPKEYVKA